LFFLLKLLLAGAHSLLATDERVTLVREGSPFLVEYPTVFLDLGRLCLKRALSLLEFCVLRLQAFVELLQRV